jgi:chemotaxis protein MotB
MARTSHLLALSAIVSFFAATGCVSQEKYNALKLDRDAHAERLATAEQQGRAAQAEADSYKNQLAQLMQNGGNLQALVSNLNQQNAALQAQLDEINGKYRDAMNRPMSGGALPPALSNELSAFAQQNPDLVDFDAARGIVKFKSDVTFAVGDATLSSRAREVIQRFASILNSPTASSYELLVAGHTDNQRVTNPKTISAGHKDNWYLSAHRAISVAGDLMAQGVSSQRVGVIGYADQRPIASNSNPNGQQQNRRVEVLILPTTIRGGGGPAVTGSGRPRMLNKDSAAGSGEMSRPVYNK